MVEERLVDPCGRRTTHADGARPSTSVASSHEGRTGNARDRTDRRERKGEMGARDNGEKRKQHLARCLSLSNHSNNSNDTFSTNNSSSNGSGSRVDAALVTCLTLVRRCDWLCVQLCKLQSSLAKGLHRNTISCYLNVILVSMGLETARGVVTKPTERKTFYGMALRFDCLFFVEYFALDLTMEDEERCLRCIAMCVEDGSIHHFGAHSTISVTSGHGR